MNLIGFSHHYTKMHGQVCGQLICVDVVHIEYFDLDSDWIKYDTEYLDDTGFIHYSNYLKPETKYVRLVFLGNKGIPFTTYREYKDGYVPKRPWDMFCGTLVPRDITPYSDLIGEDFVFKFRGEPVPDGLQPESKKYDVMIYD